MSENEIDNEQAPAFKLAQQLSQYRQSSGLSLQQVAMATKISITFLQALESGQAEELPELVFSRGFIRNLAKLYEVDPKELLALLNVALGEEEDIIKPDQALEVRTSMRPIRFRKPPLGDYLRELKKVIHLRQLRIASLAVAVIGLASLGYYAWYMPSQMQAQKTESAKLQDFAQAVRASDGEKEEKLVVVAADPKAVNELEGSESKSQEELGKLIGSGTQQVALSVSRQVRLKVQVDGSEWRDETLEADKYRYAFNEELRLLVYDAGAVDLSFNGEKLGVLGTKGALKRLSFKSQPLEQSKQ